MTQSTHVNDLLAAQGMSAAGDPELVFDQPWARISRIDTSDGSLYIKEPCAANRSEAVLTRWLHEQFPDIVPAVVATDPDTGAFLTRDGGSTMREALQEPYDPSFWHDVLTRYAQLQIECIGQANALRDAGIHSARVADLPALFPEVIGFARDERMNLPGGLTEMEIGQLRSLEERFVECCEQLFVYGIPDTLHHDDLHDENIFADGRIFDWGDAYLSHPFFALRLVIRVTERRMELLPGDPALAPLVEAYLQAWGDFGSPQLLGDCWAVAQKVEHLVHAQTWRRVTADAPPAFFADRKDPVSGCLRDLLHALST
jgi:hypothetical protein